MTRVFALITLLLVNVLTAPIAPAAPANASSPTDAACCPLCVCDGCSCAVDQIPDPAEPSEPAPASATARADVVAARTHDPHPTIEVTLPDESQSLASAPWQCLLRDRASMRACLGIWRT